MEFSNDGLSVYHRVLGAYARDHDGELVRCVGQERESVEKAWSSIQPDVTSKENGSASGPQEPVTSSLPVSPGDSNSSKPVEIHEVESEEQRQVLGLVVEASESDKTLNAPPLEQNFSKLILDQMSLDTQKPSSDLSTVRDVSSAIVDLFDRHLRYEVPNDQWDAKGREFFLSKVQHFTSRNLRIEMCLPAFPCKSSNPKKVAGKLPDKGEEMALRTLHDFVRHVEEIYEPGARVWIISDGHVFSDCIGVDDDTVDLYGKKLKELNEAIEASSERVGRVCFRSLVDLFNLKKQDTLQPEKVDELGVPDIDHHVGTEVTEDAEICRRILMAGFQPDKDSLKDKIDAQDSSLLALYRGFSRFMLEDLDLHPRTQKLSRSQRKKLASKVSFEMIARNQAYSNLVSLIFPDYIRLSIHAHDNAGPKFGVQLLQSDEARAADSLDVDTQSSADILHIPTPWHNSVAKVEDKDLFFVLKSRIIDDALSGDQYSGEWTDDDLKRGKGGYFALSKSKSEEPADEDQRQAVSSPVSVCG